ncbi:triose-phosphate isomerase [Gluconobacter sp. DsW_056]|uniref:triose-phosphate isomerase n=1 Tax=Gluconobacter sp. DsW_056 TaxID=1511209 RepID=UPI000A3CD417|nr:triose-phosphate isomerase [Gluconobacter sp. DsW_056]
MIPSPRLVVGNWKMHGLREQSTRLARAVAEGAQALPDDVRLVLCPPFTQLASVHGIINAAGPAAPLCLGAQDCHTTSSGPHTGDISADMLSDLGVQYVILGHSERRQAHGETDALIRRKVEAAEAAGLIPVVCIGETMEERLEGRTTTVLATQVEGSLMDDFSGVLAYEPVWAIGSGSVPPIDELERTLSLLHGLLQSRLKMDDIHVPILYGGSVTPAQAPTIFSIGSLGGVLVGSASLEAKSFLRIAESASLRLSAQPLSGPYRS